MMANFKELVMQQTIHTLREQGNGIRAIARMLGISRNTVRRYVTVEDSATVVQTDPPESKVPTGSVAPNKSPSSSIIPARSQSKCLPFQEIIEEKIGQHLHAQRIYQDLINEHSFDGGYDSVKRFVQRLTQADGIAHRRMESPPGFEAQVDFGKGAWIVDDNGKRRKTHMLRVVLSNSRKGYTESVFKQDTESFIRAVENAFRHFGGVPKTLVPDNLKAAVILADKYDPELNPKFNSFADHYNVAILPTPPRRPELKGKVERAVGYAFNSALKGRKFSSLVAQNKHLRWWEEAVADTRIHGTTQKQVRATFEVEKPFLQALPAMLFPCFAEGQRIVNRDGHVEVAKSYYSAPPEFLGRKVWVRWDTRVVRIFHPVEFRIVRIHSRVEPGKFNTHNSDISLQKISNLEHGEHYLLRELEDIDPTVQAWGIAMLRVRGIAGVRVLQGLLNLTNKVEPLALSRACERATQLQLWKLGDLRRLVKQHPAELHPELPFTQTHSIIRDLTDYTAVIGTIMSETSGEGGYMNN
jgi:transposase